MRIFGLAGSIEQRGGVLTLNIATPPPTPALPADTVLPPLWLPESSGPSHRALYIPMVGAAVEVLLPQDGRWDVLSRWVGGLWETLTIREARDGSRYQLVLNEAGLLDHLPENRNFLQLRQHLPRACATIQGNVVLVRETLGGEPADVEASVTVSNWQRLLGPRVRRVVVRGEGDGVSRSG